MKKILIANRGEIARRIIHTAHRMGIDTVAVYSDPDANALHVREATQAIALGGAASADTYLRADKLLAAARATGADAVHPGYGFLSENADFAQAVVDAGLTWIGPPPAAIRALGSKAGAKALAQAQGVPCLPGYAGEDQRYERFATEAARIGTPLMVKAVAGGGGRGMRLVTDLAQLPAALASARSEALAGFGCGDLLIDRALLQPRHVEVQVFADAHGAGAHALAQRGIHGGAGGFFDELLVAALHRTIALAQVDARSVGVGKDLHLHMARLQQRTFDQQVATAKAR